MVGEIPAGLLRGFPAIAGRTALHFRTLPRIAFMGLHLPTLPFSRSASALALACGLISQTAPLAAQASQAVVPTGGLAARLASWYEAASRGAPGQWGIAVADG